MQIRTSFTGQFLEASTIFVRRAREIEANAGADVDDSTRCEHRGLVCAVIMQCVAALETEAHETCEYGPGAYLGADRTDTKAREILSDKVDSIDATNPVHLRFKRILSLLGKKELRTDISPYQNVVSVVKLRNKLVHYKSIWDGISTDPKDVLYALKKLKHKPPPFTHPSSNFFPDKCLNAACAAWALSSVVGFLEEFYSALGVPSRFADYRNRLDP